MSDILCKIGSYYLVWSTICDAPTRIFLGEQAFKKDFMDYYPHMEKEADRAIAAAKKHGTSSKKPMSFRELIKGNRAGPGESELTYYQIYKYYCLRKKMNGWTPFNSYWRQK